MKKETYKDGLNNHCLKNDYPHLYESGESDGEDISGGDGYQCFIESLSGIELKEFTESFEDDGEGWISKFTDDTGDHFFWGNGNVGDIIVLHYVA